MFLGRLLYCEQNPVLDLAGVWLLGDGVKGNEGPVSFLFFKTVIERSFYKQREHHFGV